MSLYPNVKGTFCKFWGTHQNYLNFTRKLEYSFQSLFLEFLLDFELDEDCLALRRGVHDNAGIFTITFFVWSASFLFLVYFNP